MTVKHRAAGRRLRMPSPAMIVACIALAVALSGASYAAVVLPRNSVGTPQLKRNAVTSAKVLDNALTGQDINEAQLAQVPSAASANTANTAANATNATNATNAANADTLAGLPQTAFVRQDAVLRSYATTTFRRNRNTGHTTIAQMPGLGLLDLYCGSVFTQMIYRNTSTSAQRVWWSVDHSVLNTYTSDTRYFVTPPGESRGAIPLNAELPAAAHYTFVVQSFADEKYARAEVMLSMGQLIGECFGTTDVIHTPAP